MWRWWFPGSFNEIPARFLSVSYRLRVNTPTMHHHHHQSLSLARGGLGIHLCAGDDF